MNRGDISRDFSGSEMHMKESLFTTSRLKFSFDLLRVSSCHCSNLETIYFPPAWHECFHHTLARFFDFFCTHSRCCDFSRCRHVAAAFKQMLSSFFFTDASNPKDGLADSKFSEGKQANRSGKKVTFRLRSRHLT